MIQGRLANQAGQLVNFNELSDTLNISRQIIKHYLFILEKLIRLKNYIVLRIIKKKIKNTIIFYKYIPGKSPKVIRNLLVDE